jgi:hypothetical protein
MAQVVKADFWKSCNSDHVLTPVDRLCWYIGVPVVEGNIRLFSCQFLAIRRPLYCRS